MSSYFRSYSTVSGSRRAAAHGEHMLAVLAAAAEPLSVATARRFLIAAVAIGTFALVFGVGRPEHVKLRILTHAIPDFHTWYDGVLGPYNEPGAPITHMIQKLARYARRPTSRTAFSPLPTDMLRPRLL